MKPKPVHCLFGVFVLIICLALFFAVETHAKPPTKSKFYDFSDQIIDGHVRKPTVLYTNIREKVKFARLLSLKKSFMRQMFDAHKERIFK
jgi:hypothetical protein